MKAQMGYYEAGEPCKNIGIKIQDQLATRYFLSVKIISAVHKDRTLNRCVLSSGEYRMKG